MEAYNKYKDSHYLYAILYNLAICNSHIKANERPKKSSIGARMTVLRKYRASASSTAPAREKTL